MSTQGIRRVRISCKKQACLCSHQGAIGCRILKQVLDFANFEYQDTEAAVPERTHGSSQGLSEYESLNYLKAHGVTIPPQAVAATADEAVKAAGNLGYPLSVKIHSADIQHKSVWAV